MLEMEKSVELNNVWPYEPELKAYEHNQKKREVLAAEINNHLFSSMFKSFLVLILPPFILFELAIIAYGVFVQSNLSSKILWTILCGGIGISYGWFRLLKHAPKNWFVTKKYEKVNAILESLKTEESLIVEKIIDELGEKKNQYQLLLTLDKFHYDLSTTRNNKFMNMVFVPKLNTLKIKLIEIFDENLKEEKTKEKLFPILLEYKSFAANMQTQQKFFNENNHASLEEYEKGYHEFLQKNHYQLTPHGLMEPSDYKKSI